MPALPANVGVSAHDLFLYSNIYTVILRCQTHYLKRWLKTETDVVECCRVRGNTVYLLYAKTAPPLARINAAD
jgi:hypothetical protein